MGRHAAVDPPDHQPSRPARPRAGAGRTVRTVVVAVLSTLLVVAVAGLAVFTDVPQQAVARLAGPPAEAADDTAEAPSTAGCEVLQDVRVALGTELEPSLRALGDGPLGPTADGVCARVRGIGATPSEVLGGLARGVDGQRRPDVWVPDSTLWTERAGQQQVAVESRGSLGTSPVVVVSSPEVIDSLGWRAQPPTWEQVLATERPLAVANLGDSAGTLMAIDAARDAAGEGAGTLTVRTVLSRQRAGTLTPTQGLTQAALGGADAPLVITAEQDVLRRAATGQQDLLTAVGVQGGTPVLDYPVLDVAPVEPRDAAHQAAVELVLDALTSGPGQAMAVAAGLRGPDLAQLPGSPSLVPVNEPFITVDDVDTAAVLDDLAALQVPSRILVVVDVSLSMVADVGDGFTRADIAAQALERALQDLPDSTEVGLWFFAAELEGDQDWSEVVPVRRVGESVEGGGSATTQRALLAQSVQRIPDSLVAGGTGLYATTEAAMGTARETWDPSVVSTVLVITDGQNERSTGPTLEELQESLSAGGDPERPVGLVAVAFGPDADLAELEAITSAASSGGAAQAVNARNPNALQGLLVELLAARTGG